MKPHITVCICTYQRPRRLEETLDGVSEQRTEDEFTYSAVVVDNDIERSAQQPVAEYSGRSGLQITYACEPEKNIARARNKAVGLATGDYVAFIDDDEVPPADWLARLLHAAQEYESDGVLGPVRPLFAKPPAEWILKGRFFDRESYETGTVLQNPEQTRTGNVLLKAGLLTRADGSEPFDPRFGMGGEDVDFFRQALAAGALLVWCDEAPVYEDVPEERLKAVYFLRRAVLRGTVNGSRDQHSLVSTVKSLVAVVVYPLTMPFCAIFGRHRLLQVLVSYLDHLAKLLSRIGIRLVKERKI
jgi:succinoglycan biosynthesis protein ExoM